MRRGVGQSHQRKKDKRALEEMERKKGRDKNKEYNETTEQAITVDTSSRER